MTLALVTGAAGFVGSAVVKKLLERGVEVRALARPTSDLRNLEGLPIEVVTGDLTDPASLAAACRGCDVVFHVAADYRLWVPDPDRMMAANVQGTRQLIEAALNAGVQRIVYTSSVAALAAMPKGEIADETTPITLEKVVGTYKRSKYLAEREVDRLVEEKQAPVVTVNPAAPVGPGDIKPTPTGRMILQAAKGAIPAYVDTGLNVVHVDDVAEGHLLAWERGRIGERYILGSENLYLRDMLTLITEIAGARPPRIRLNPDMLMPVAAISELTARLLPNFEPMVTRDTLKMSKKTMFFHADKAKRELGFAPREAREAISDAIQWFRTMNML